MLQRRPYLLFVSFMYGVLFHLGNVAMPSYTNALDVSDTFVGFYLASTGLGLFIFATLWGAIGDIKNRDKVLAVIFLGFGMGQFLFGLFRTEIMLLVASLFSGIFYAGVLVNLYSFINDTFTLEQERNKMLSYAVSLYLLGMSFAYIIGGVLTDLVVPNVHLVYYIQAMLLVFCAVFIYVSKIDLVDTDHHLTRVYFWNVFRQAFRLHWVPIYTITLTFFISFSHQNVKRFLDYYVIDSGYSPTELGFVVGLAGLIGLLSNLYIAPYFLKRIHNFRFLQIQFVFAPIFLYLLTRADNLMFGLYTFYMGYTLILTIYEPTAISFMSDNKAVSQGVLVGVRQSIVGLGTTIGFIIGGILYGIEELYVFYLSIGFYIIVFLGFSVLIVLKYKDVKDYRRAYLEEARK